MDFIMEELDPWVEDQLARDHDSQQPLVRDSQASQLDKQCPNFTKHPWLADFFERIEVEGKSHVQCKNCLTLWKSRSCLRLIGHHNKCISNFRDGEMGDMGEIGEMGDKIETVDQDSSDTIRNKLWAEVIIENNLPLKCIESKSFKKFSAYICRAWHLPSRQELSNIYIPKLSRKLQDRFTADLKRGRFSHLSVEFDHWSDINNRSYLGVIATSRSGERYLLDLRDVSLRGHKSDVIVEVLTDILKIIPSTLINSIISDSASCCKKARQDFVQKDEYKNCIQHRCLAHILNNIGSRITTKNESIASTLKGASIIASTVRNSSYWTAYIRDLKENLIPAASRVRWYSTVTMLTGLSRLKDVIIENIAPSLSVDDRVIIESLDWDHLDHILNILGPLNRCIGIVERKAISLGEAFNAILHYARELFIDGPLSDALGEARRSFLWHFNPVKFGEKEFGILLAAYALDRRSKLNFITEEGLHLVLATIIRVAAISNITLKRIQSCINQDFERFKNFEDEYGTSLDDNRQVKWWTDRVSGGVLSAVGIRLAHLKASSANIERAFSTIKSIQGQSRARLLRSTLVQIARLKISYIDDLDDDELEEYDRELERSELETDLYSTQDESSLNGSVNESLDGSIISNSSSLSTSEPRKLPDWMEHQGISMKRDYQAFFKYVDFTIMNEPPNSSSPASSNIPEDQIENYINSIQVNSRKRQRSEPDVIIEPVEPDDIVILMESSQE